MQLEQERRLAGEKAPSDMAQALADSTDFDEPSGFVGKYLKKHHDMKMKAQ